MFVAKFTQTSGDKFTADKNGQMPFIGEVLAGSARGTLINGTMFQRDGLVPNKMYFCDNVEEEYNGTKQVRTIILSEVSPLDYVGLRVQLGAPKLQIGEPVADPAAQDPVEIV